MTNDHRHDLEIAIIGMAGRFPGAGSIEAFWRNLRAGVESIRDLSDDEARAAGVDDATRNDPRFVRRAADLEGAELFDAGLFGFTPREAELMDPQFRVFLEDSWSALEDAGYLSDRPDLRVGVFAGASGNTYLHQNVLADPRAARAVGAFGTSIGNERDYLATHVSYRLDLRGPSLVVQTACSTSLVAVHLACQSLLNGECDVALAGGVSISLPQTTGYLYEEGGIASPDGRCRAFDASAAGCVKGNGSGAVVLRRLEDALRDADAIRAVIKGSAVNNDGRGKIGFTAPSVAGQSSVVAEALSAAGVDPRTIGYVEAHGTATPLGDPVEVAALARAFGLQESDPSPDAGLDDSRRAAPAAREGDGPAPMGFVQGPSGPRSTVSGAEAAQRCALGSVKTNIGHLDAAAGVAGLIKAVLALEHREIPPSLHFERPNPRTGLAGLHFAVNTDLRPWPRSDGPRRAGVSSFGIGGTNAHVILEEAPDAARVSRARGAQLLVLSAASETALAAASEALAARLEAGVPLDLADAAFTLQVGRKRLPWRRAIVAARAQEAVAALRHSGRRDAARQDERRGAEVAFLFPGQGAQYAGMARSLHREEPAFREAFDRCAGILAPELGCDLRSLVLDAEPPRGSSIPDQGADGTRAGEDGGDERLRETSLAQPALFAVSYSLAKLWMSWGVRPAVMAGHSVGEYVAAALAGVLSLEDALALVAERGRLMGAMPHGAMLAAALGEADLASRLARHPALSLAAVNGPASCVASGPVAAIEGLEVALAADGVAYRRLRTSHAFHSAMMDPVVGAFEERVRGVPLRAPAIPFLSNVTGAWISEEQATDPGYWSAHLRRTVRFGDSIATLLADPSRILLEVGPGTTLASLARRQAGPGPTIAASLPRASEETAGLLEAAGALWCAGADVDWEVFHEGHGRGRVPLPTYPFERRRYWIEARTGGDERETSGSPGAPSKNPDLAAWFSIPGWRRSRLHEGGDNVAAAEDAERDWLLLDDGSDLARALAEHAMSRGGARVARVRAGARYAREEGDAFTIDPRSREHYDRLLRDLRANGLRTGRIVHLWCADGSRLDPLAGLDLGFFAMLAMLQAICQSGDGGGLRVVAVAGDLFDVAGEAVLCPERATLVGVCRVASHEHPELACRLVDVAIADTGEAARRVAAELEANDREPVVVWRGGHRWIPSYERERLVPAAGEPPGIVPEGGYVLTGGTGPFELALARRLAAAGARALTFLECGSGAESAVAELRADGVRVACSPARVTDPAALGAAVADARTRSGRLDAVFHTAGPIGGGMMQLKTREAAETVLAPRLTGARALAELLQDGERLVLFSSVISATGVFGQVDFCAASAFLDALAHARRGGTGARVLAIDWGTAAWDRWQGPSGAGSGALLERLREVQKEVGITIEEGVEALWRALAVDEPQIVVVPEDLDALIAKATASSAADLLGDLAEGAPRAPDRAGRSVVALATDTERRVAAAWSDLLGVAPIGRTDSFFDLGGNSLLAIQLAARLRKAFEVDLTIASLFEAADLASLAGAVDAGLEERREAEEVARLLEEIEGLTEEEVRRELRRGEGEDEAESAA